MQSGSRLRQPGEGWTGKDRVGSTGSGYAFGWAGEQYDDSSDLTYLRARYYSPGTAGFLSRDTIQPNGGGTTGYNPYAYANGNPVTFTDPSGHIATWVGGGIAAVQNLTYLLACSPARLFSVPVFWKMRRRMAMVLA